MPYIVISMPCIVISMSLLSQIVKKNSFSIKITILPDTCFKVMFSVDFNSQISKTISEP